MFISFLEYRNIGAKIQRERRVMKCFGVLILMAMTLLSEFSLSFASSSKLVVPLVIVGGDKRHCGSGTIKGLDPEGDGFLAVKAGPGLNFRRIDKLYNGQEVYICQEIEEWLGIVYPGDNVRCCDSTDKDGTFIYKGPCASGWVHRNWVLLTAG
jgi:hypothetical protein